MPRAVSTLLSAIALLAVGAAPVGAQVVQKIVFASDRDGTYDIWAMNPDGSGQVKLAGSPTADEFSPVASPDGNRIAFIRGLGPTNGEPEGDLMVMNSDGSGQTTVTFGANDPSWSPDGNKLSFGSIAHSSRDGELWTINANGSGATAVAPSTGENLGTSWSPDGQRIAFHTQLTLPPFPDTNDGIWRVDVDGTDLTELKQASADPDWSPDGSKIAYSGLATMNPDGTGQGAVPNASGVEPAWSPEGSQLAFFRFTGGSNEIYRVNTDGSGLTPLTANPASDIDPDWFVSYQGYARPKGATPVRVSLAPAYRACASPNRTHGPPLASPSCAGPQQTSQYLTVGSADSNGLPTRSEGYLVLSTVVGNPATPADEADVRIDSFVNDVFTKAGLADYTADVHTHLMVRVTDRDNAGPTAPTGTLEIEIHFDTPCTATADPQEGSVCALTTTWDSLIPGFVKEGKRTIWALKRIEVQDGGADGDGMTTGDNTLFATPALFVP